LAVSEHNKLESIDILHF